MFTPNFNFDFTRNGMFNFQFVQHRPPFLPPTLSHTFSYDPGRGITAHINQISSHISSIPRPLIVNPIELIPPVPEPQKLDLMKHEVTWNRSKKMMFIIRDTEPKELSSLKEAHNSILNDIFSGKLLNDEPQAGAPAEIVGVDMIIRSILLPPQIEKDLKRTEQAVYNYCLK